MSDPANLIGFAYGERVEGSPPRSLGYGLLTPTDVAPWTEEIATLARWLQAAPFPDHWPAADLFCSILLADGRRLVALARYGLADHTPDRRRGGVELLGVLAPGALDVAAARAICRWLRQRRAAAKDLITFGGSYELSDVVKAVPPEPATPRPTPMLAMQPEPGAPLLFAAGCAGDPDFHLGLLDQFATSSWQWLPLIGPDYPLRTQGERGPLVAWTPYRIPVAVRLDAATPAGSSRRSPLAAVLAALLLILLTANLGAAYLLHHQLSGKPSPISPVQPVQAPTPSPAAPAGNNAPCERFVAELHKLLQDQGGLREWEGNPAPLLARYERIARERPDLRVAEGDAKARSAVAAVSVLAERNAERVEETVRRALSNKGFSDRLIKAACDHVHEQFVADFKDGP